MSSQKAFVVSVIRPLWEQAILEGKGLSRNLENSRRKSDKLEKNYSSTLKVPIKTLTAKQTQLSDICVDKTSPSFFNFKWQIYDAVWGSSQLLRFWIKINGMVKGVKWKLFCHSVQIVLPSTYHVKCMKRGHEYECTVSFPSRLVCSNFEATIFNFGKRAFWWQVTRCKRKERENKNHLN